jgi:hypothetical protein
MIVTACWSVLKAKAEKHESELVEIGEKLNLSILYKYKILNFSIKKRLFLLKKEPLLMTRTGFEPVLPP